MIKASPLLFIGLFLSLWARSMTHEDFVKVGMGKNGHLEFRTAAGAVSVSASRGIHKLGQWFSFEKVSRPIQREKHPHQGFNGSFKGPMNWELRVTMIGIMSVVIFMLVILMKMYKRG